MCRFEIPIWKKEKCVFKVEIIFLCKLSEMIGFVDIHQNHSSTDQFRNSTKEILKSMIEIEDKHSTV